MIGKALAAMMRFLVSGFSLALASCVSAPDSPNGCIAYSPAVPFVASFGRACAIQLNEHWAVSVRHGAKVLNTSLEVSDLVVSRDYDLAFFKHDGPAPAWRLEGLRVGEPVTAAGNPSSIMDYVVALPVPTRETAAGKIVAKVWYCRKEDADCAWTIGFDGPVEKGYSGGPLLDAEGKVIGKTIAKTTKPITMSDGNIMAAGTGIALPAGVIWAEFRRLVPDEAISPSP